MPEDRSVFDRDTPEPDQVLAYGDHADQCIDFYEGDPAAPIIALIHGGYWSPTHDRIHLRPLARALADDGYNVGLIEYRRELGAPQQYTLDVAAAISMLSGAAPVVAVGHSAGGHLALLVAAVLEVPVLALAPVADMAAAVGANFDDGAAAKFLGEQPAAEFDPMLQVTLLPVTVIHGVGDTLVPVRVSRDYADRHDNAQLVEIADIAHFEVIDPFHPTYEVVRGELDKITSSFA